MHHCHVFIYKYVWTWVHIVHTHTYIYIYTHNICIYFFDIIWKNIKLQYNKLHVIICIYIYHCAYFIYWWSLFPVFLLEYGGFLFLSSTNSTSTPSQATIPSGMYSQRHPNQSIILPGDLLKTWGCSASLTFFLKGKHHFLGVPHDAQCSKHITYNIAFFRVTGELVSVLPTIWMWKQPQNE